MRWASNVCTSAQAVEVTSSWNFMEPHGSPEHTMCPFVAVWVRGHAQHLGVDEAQFIHFRMRMCTHQNFDTRSDTTKQQPKQHSLADLQMQSKVKLST